MFDPCVKCEKSVWGEKGIIETIRARDILCGKCRAELKFLGSTFEWNGVKLYIAYEYDDYMASLLFQYKNGDTKLAQVFFYHCYAKIKKKNKIVVIPPSSDRKTQERGFLPLDLALSYYSIPVLHPFIKDDDYEQKTSKDREGLKSHIHFDATLEIHKKYILVDDVATSGTTLETCLELIRASGVKDVEIYLLSATSSFIESMKKDIRNGWLKRYIKKMMQICKNTTNSSNVIEE